MVRGLLFAVIGVMAVLPGTAAALETGESVTLPSATGLLARPVDDAETLAPLPAGATVTLVGRTENPSGAWWFVNAGDSKGWLRESVLRQNVAETGAPAAVAPAAGSAAAPVAPAAARAPSRATLPTRTGTREFELDADLSQADFEGSETRNFSVRAKFGHFVTPRHELGAFVSYSKQHFDDSDFGDADLSGYGVGPFYTINFPSSGSNVVPFVGVAAIKQHVDVGISFKGFAYEANAGVRVFAGDNLSVNISAYYQESTLDADGVDAEQTAYGLRIGLSGFLQPD